MSLPAKLHLHFGPDADGAICLQRSEYWAPSQSSFPDSPHESRPGWRRGVAGTMAVLLHRIASGGNRYTGPCAKSAVDTLRGAVKGTTVWCQLMFGLADTVDPTDKKTGFLIPHESNPRAVEIGPALMQAEIAAFIGERQLTAGEAGDLARAIEGLPPGGPELVVRVAKGRRDPASGDAPVIEEGEWADIRELPAAVPLTERDYLSFVVRSPQPMHLALFWLDGHGECSVLHPAIGVLNPESGGQRHLDQALVGRLASCQQAVSRDPVVITHPSRKYPGFFIDPKAALSETVLLVASATPIDWDALAEAFQDLPRPIAPLTPDEISDLRLVEPGTAALRIKQCRDLPRGLDLSDLGSPLFDEVLPRRLKAAGISHARALHVPSAAAHV